MCMFAYGYHDGGGTRHTHRSRERLAVEARARHLHCLFGVWHYSFAELYLLKLFICVGVWDYGGRHNACVRYARFFFLLGAWHYSVFLIATCYLCICTVRVCGTCVTACVRVCVRVLYIYIYIYICLRTQYT